MPVDLQAIEQRAEIQQLYSALSKVESVAKNLVGDAQDEADAIDRAKKIEYRLRTLFEQTGDDCAPGTVWDPVTQSCV